MRRGWEEIGHFSPSTLSIRTSYEACDAIPEASDMASLQKLYLV